MNEPEPWWWSMLKRGVGWVWWAALRASEMEE